MTASVAFGAVLVGALTVLPSSRSAAAQNRDLEIWDGVYTSVQARRGESAFQTHCVSCHGADLGGLDPVGARVLRDDLLLRGRDLQEQREREREAPLEVFLGSALVVPFVFKGIGEVALPGP